MKRSVHVAEQLRMEKAETEYEVGQLKMQIDRQQGRIRSLIEEQVQKADEEREEAERRWQEKIR